MTNSPASGIVEGDKSTETPPLRRPLLAPHARYRWDKLRSEHQLLFPEGILVLNETGAAIVRLCDGRSLGDLLAALGAEYPNVDLGDEVRVFLNRLVHKRLVRDARRT